MIYFLTILSFFLGYYLHEVLNALKAIKNQSSEAQKVQEAKKIEARKMTFADEMTPAEFAAFEEEERIKALNG